VPESVIVQGFEPPEQYDAVSGALTSARKVKLPLYGTVIEPGFEEYAPPLNEYLAVVDASGIVGKLPILTVTFPLNPPTEFIETVLVSDCDQPAGRKEIFIVSAAPSENPGGCGATVNETFDEAIVLPPEAQVMLKVYGPLMRPWVESSRTK